MADDSDMYTLDEEDQSFLEGNADDVNCPKDRNI